MKLCLCEILYFLFRKGNIYAKHELNPFTVIINNIKEYKYLSFQKTVIAYE